MERHGAICLNGVTPADITYRPLASALGMGADLRLKDLEGYAAEFPIEYNLDTEVVGVSRVAADAKWASPVVDVYEERSHFDPPHVAEARRFAVAVQENWERALAAS